MTDNVLSLLADYESRIRKGEITPEYAKKEAVNQIRHLRYGHEGKDYFWINDMHPNMIMHPYRQDLDGTDLTQFRDMKGNRLFVAMVEEVKKNQSGYVDYYWQWKDAPEKIVPKISYVKGFKPWGWIIGTGIYVEDIQKEIRLITQRFIYIFTGILILIILLSFYIANQILRMDQARAAAEKSRNLEELRLKSLFDLSQMTQKSIRDLTEFALEEAIALTESQIGFLAFLNDDETQLTMHTWSRNTMKQCEIKDKILIYSVNETGLWAEAARTRKPVIINDYKNYSSAFKKGYPNGHVPITRIISVPIFDDDKMVAVAGVGNKKSDYNQSDDRQLRLMMDGMLKILHRKTADDNLRQSEQRYRLLADNASDGIWVVSLSDLKFSYVSPAMERISGFSIEEYSNLTAGEHMTEESVKRVNNIIGRELMRDAEENIDKNRYRVIEIEMYRKDNTLISAEVTAKFLRDENGRPDRILGITRDITQRKELEKELLASYKELKLAQQLAGVGNWSYDPDTDTATWSDEIYRIYERTPQQGPLSREKMQRYYKDKWFEIADKAVEEAITNGIDFDLELEIRLPSNKIKWIHTICRPEKQENGSGYFLKGTTQDITERKNFEIRIQQAQKMEALGTLAGGIAHDFNNILSSIIGFTELSKLIVNDNEELSGNLDRVMSAGLRARDLVKHILTFSRKAESQKDDINITSLIKECLQFIRASIPPNIEIKKNFYSQNSLVYADPTQLHQVFMNLFTNAAHAMKEKGGILDVTLKSTTIYEEDTLQSKDLNPGKYILISISDTGIGIPPHLTEKIFEPFFTTKQRGEGTGMGLSLVYGIIKEMNAGITVYSEPGMGTTFRLLIPEQLQVDNAEKRFKNTPLVRGSGRILLVDDEPSIIEWTSQIMGQLGYDVKSYTSSTEAADEFQKDPAGFDLVLTDLAMPKMSGLELTDLIKSLRPELPVILCTGFSEGLTQESIRNYDIEQMIMKPIISSELAKAVREALSKTAVS